MKTYSLLFTNIALFTLDIIICIKDVNIPQLTCQEVEGMPFKYFCLKISHFVLISHVMMLPVIGYMQFVYRRLRLHTVMATIAVPYMGRQAPVTRGCFKEDTQSTAIFLFSGDAVAVSPIKNVDINDRFISVFGQVVTMATLLFNRKSKF